MAREYRINQPLMEILSEEPRKVVFVALRLLNIPSTLRQVVEVLSRNNVNILGGLHYGPAGSKESIWIFAADFTEAVVNPDRVFDEIRKLKVVLSVEYGAKQIGRIVFPPFHISLNILDRGIIIQRKSWLREINRVIIEELGAGAEALVYHVGFRAGYRVVDYWQKASGLSGSDLIILAFEAVKVFNWISDYKIIRLDIDKYDMVFRVWDLMDCAPFRGQLNRPASHYFRGIMSGYISKVFGREIVLEEKKCIAVGDLYCEFVSTTGRG